MCFPADVFQTHLAPTAAAAAAAAYPAAIQAPSVYYTNSVRARCVLTSLPVLELSQSCNFHSASLALFIACYCHCLVSPYQQTHITTAFMIDVHN